MSVRTKARRNSFILFLYIIMKCRLNVFKSTEASNEILIKLDWIYTIQIISKTDEYIVLEISYKTKWWIYPTKVTMDHGQYKMFISRIMYD